jgi:DNA-binding NtrC family response regulator
MRPRLILLLSNDPEVELQFRQASAAEGATFLVTHNIGEALRTICARLDELDLAVIDFQEGCRGMTIINAIHTCREELPIVVLTSTDKCHTAALAYANGATACLAKPTTPEEIEILIENLRRAAPQLAAA